MNKAERLIVAGVVAPVLRSSVNGGRRVAVTDADGKVTGWTTVAEIQASLLAKQKIELEVIDGVRPAEVLCKNCGKSIRTTKNGPLPTVCREGCNVFCSFPDCGRQISPNAARKNALKGILKGHCIKCDQKVRKQKRGLCCCGNQAGDSGLCKSCFVKKYVKERKQRNELLGLKCPCGRVLFSKLLCKSCMERGRRQRRRAGVPAEAKKIRPLCGCGKDHITKTGLCRGCYHKLYTAKKRKEARERNVSVSALVGVRGVSGDSCGVG